MSNHTILHISDRPNHHYGSASDAIAGGYDHVTLMLPGLVIHIETPVAASIALAILEATRESESQRLTMEAAKEQVPA